MKLKFFYIFTIQETILTYVSGIFTASAINILTSQIPKSILSIGDSAYSFIIIAVLFIIISFLLIRWSTTVTIAKIKYNKNNSILTEENKRKIWYDTLCDCGINQKLFFNFVFIVVCTIVSAMLLLYPDFIHFLLVTC